MSIKKGIVMEITANKATLLTKTGEFVTVKIKSTVPSLGQEYTGNKFTLNKFFKYPVIAACLMFMVFLGNNIYAYYTPVASITISINPSLKVKINKWNKIIKITALNKDGETLLKTLDIKNKSLQTGLNEIVEEAKKDNFINENYVNSGKVITVSVDSDKDSKIDISQFETYLKTNNLKIVIDDNIQNPATPTTKSKEDTKEKAPKNNENNSNATNIPNDKDINKNHSNDTKINSNANNSSTKHNTESTHKPSTNNKSDTTISTDNKNTITNTPNNNNHTRTNKPTNKQQPIKKEEKNSSSNNKSKKNNNNLNNKNK